MLLLLLLRNPTVHAVHGRGEDEHLAATSACYWLLRSPCLRCRRGCSSPPPSVTTANSRKRRRRRCRCGQRLPKSQQSTSAHTHAPIHAHVHPPTHANTQTLPHEPRPPSLARTSVLSLSLARPCSLSPNPTCCSCEARASILLEVGHVGFSGPAEGGVAPWSGITNSPDGPSRSCPTTSVPGACMHTM